jgi:hypothetical protein
MINKRERSKEQRFVIDAGQYLDVPDAVEVDGVVVPNIVTVETFGESSEMLYEWKFPFFRQSVSYDPVVAMSSVSGSTTTTSATSHLVPNLSLFFIAFLSLTFLFA